MDTKPYKMNVPKELDRRVAVRAAEEGCAKSDLWVRAMVEWLDTQPIEKSSHDWVKAAVERTPLPPENEDQASKRQKLRDTVEELQKRPAVKMDWLGNLPTLDKRDEYEQKGPSEVEKPAGTLVRSEQVKKLREGKK